jgi:hypothetical protein
MMHSNGERSALLDSSVTGRMLRICAPPRRHAHMQHQHVQCDTRRGAATSTRCQQLTKAKQREGQGSELRRRRVDAPRVVAILSTGFCMLLN